MVLFEIQMRFVSNRRLSKHQMIRAGIEFDIYVERQNNLAIPYDEAFAHAVMFSGIKVACLEHLLILKLNAHIDRISSSKGDKDRRDIVTIVMAMNDKFHRDQLMPHLREKHVQSLCKIEESSVFTEMSAGNSHKTKSLRNTFDGFLIKIMKLMETDK